MPLDTVTRPSRPAAGGPEAGEAPACELSIVVTARNDDHGGNLLGRMQVFVNGLLEQSRRHRWDAELILVEWNPPEDRPLLAQALNWPLEPGTCPVRIIEVPPALHRRFQHADRLPLFQMIAKNVGIRRARGRFILVTNIDLLLSNELAAFLAPGALEPGRLYRIDRHDVSANVPLEASLDEQLEFCRRNVIRINAREGTRDLRSGHVHHIYYPEQGVRGRLRPAVERYLHRRGGDRPPGFFARRLWSFVGRERLHTNACGDFTLLDRQSWSDVRGYPEFEIFSMHLDSLLCFMAYYAGAREQILVDPMRLYHIEHGSGWSPEVERSRTLLRRLETLGLQQLTDEQFQAWALQMRRERRPIVFNEESWGLVHDDLPQITLSEARSLR